MHVLGGESAVPLYAISRGLSAAARTTCTGAEGRACRSQSGAQWTAHSLIDGMDRGRVACRYDVSAGGLWRRSRCVPGRAALFPMCFLPEQAMGSAPLLQAWMHSWAGGHQRCGHERTSLPLRSRVSKRSKEYIFC